MCFFFSEVEGEVIKTIWFKDMGFLVGPTCNFNEWLRGTVPGGRLKKHSAIHLRLQVVFDGRKNGKR